MADKTSSTEVTQQKKVFVKSEAVLKEMEANGQLEPFTDYYTPDDDGVDDRNSQLVIDYTVPSDTSSVTINNLNLVEDGGVYDIVFAGGSVNGDFYLETNNAASGYYYSGFRFHIGSMTRKVAYNTHNFLISESPYNGHITMHAHINNVYIDTSSSVVRSGDYGNFINNGFAPVSNVTSIKFYATTIYADFNIKIYKRASNSPTRS